jgi:hypothetical protein
VPSGGPWKISVRDNGSFTTALFVRDAFGLSVGHDIPRLTPDVGLAETVDIDPADWDAWWRAIVDAGPEIGGVAPPTGPDLFLLQEQVARGIARWTRRGRDPQSHEAALAPARLVAELEKSLGRRASFAFFVDVLPVLGPWHLDLSPTWTLISTDVWLDTDLLVPLLEERFAPLI